MIGSYRGFRTESARCIPSGAAEELYELSTATIEAIRFLSAIAEPHSAANASRLSLVIHALTGLAEDTDTDKHRRIDHLDELHYSALSNHINSQHLGQRLVYYRTGQVDRQQVRPICTDSLVLKLNVKESAACLNG